MLKTLMGTGPRPATCFEEFGFFTKIFQQLQITHDLVFFPLVYTVQIAKQNFNCILLDVTVAHFMLESFRSVSYLVLFLFYFLWNTSLKLFYNEDS